MSILQAKPVPMILDTDTFNEIDDQFALVYALCSPEHWRVAGVTAAPFLNARSDSAGDGMRKSHDEILRILELMGCRGRIPACAGSTRFMEGKRRAVESHAAGFIAEAARRANARGEVLHICAIAALTNVASALLIDPEIRRMIRIIWLGGHRYDMGRNDEFNLRQDVAAAQTVFDSGCELWHLPCLGVVQALRIGREELDRELDGGDRASEYLRSIFHEFLDRRELKDKVLWDISTIASLTVPEAFRFRMLSAPLLHDDMRWELTSGRHRIRVAEHVDRDPVFTDLFRRLRRNAELCGGRHVQNF